MGKHPIWVRKLNIVKIILLPTLIHRFNTIAIKIVAGFFAEIDKLIVRVTLKFTGPRIAKTNLEKKKKERTMLKDSHDPISKLTTKATKSRQCNIDIRIDV